MAKERGVVTTLIAAKRYGFIVRPVPPGQAKLPDVFLLFGSYPQGEVPKIGDELEFEPVTEPGKKGPKATDITIVSKVIPTAPASLPATTPTPAPQPTQKIASAAPIMATSTEPLDVVVEFLYDAQEVIETPEAFEIPVVVRVSNPDGTRLRRANVALWCDKQPSLNPEGSNWYTTDHNGEVPFLLGYWRQSPHDAPITVTRLHLDVQVSYAGKQVMQSQMVPRSKDLKAQAVPAPPVQPKLTVEVSEGLGCKQYLVGYGTPDASIPATFEVWPTRSCQIAVSDDGGSNWQTTTGGKLVFPSNGQSVLWVKIEKLAPDVGGENIFIGVQGANSKSGPYYISGIQ